MTLQPPHDIDQVLRARSSWDNIKNFRDASEYYGPHLTKIIEFLLDPPKDSSLAKTVQEYKQLEEEEE